MFLVVSAQNYTLSSSVVRHSNCFSDIDNPRWTFHGFDSPTPKSVDGQCYFQWVNVFFVFCFIGIIAANLTVKSFINGVFRSLLGRLNPSRGKNLLSLWFRMLQESTGEILLRKKSNLVEYMKNTKHGKIECHAFFDSFWFKTSYLNKNVKQEGIFLKWGFNLQSWSQKQVILCVNVPTALTV